MYNSKFNARVFTGLQNIIQQNEYQIQNEVVEVQEEMNASPVTDAELLNIWNMDENTFNLICIMFNIRNIFCNCKI